MYPINQVYYTRLVGYIIPDDHALGVVRNTQNIPETCPIYTQFIPDLYPIKHWRHSVLFHREYRVYIGYISGIFRVYWATDIEGTGIYPRSVGYISSVCRVYIPDLYPVRRVYIPDLYPPWRVFTARFSTFLGQKYTRKIPKKSSIGPGIYIGYIPGLWTGYIYPRTSGIYTRFMVYYVRGIRWCETRPEHDFPPGGRGRPGCG